MGAGLAIGAGVTSIIGSTVTAFAAGKRAKDAKERANILDGTIKTLENSRQQITNPYADITNTFENLSNQYANLGVATQAAEFQAEEADISLANTLDTLRAVGMGAGGATALAQAALRSKKGISASIEQQEVTNSQLRAQGEMTIQQQKAMGEASVQQQKASGEQWRLSMQESREVASLDRAQALYDNEKAQEMYDRQQMWSAIGNVGSSAMDMSANYNAAKAAGSGG